MLLKPPPIGNHCVPSQRAASYAVTPPALENDPPATRSPFRIANVRAEEPLPDVKRPGWPMSGS